MPAVGSLVHLTVLTDRPDPLALILVMRLNRQAVGMLVVIGILGHNGSPSLATDEILCHGSPTSAMGRAYTSTVYVSLKVHLELNSSLNRNRIFRSYTYTFSKAASVRL